MTLKKEPYPAIWFYGFNMEDPIVGKNKPLRQAISMAFDRQKYIDLFANGRGQPAIGPIPPGFPIFDPNLKNPYTAFNVEGARAKLTEAESINGGAIPTLRFLLPGTDTVYRQMGDFMNQQMAQIGISLNVEYVTWARFQEMIDAKQAQMYALGWVADYPDEQTFLQLFYSKNAAPGPNSANYSNPAYDALYEKASVMNPGPERDELYRQMQQITMEDCPWLLNYYSISYTLYYDWVENFGSSEYMHGARKHYKLNSEKRRSLARH
jgi:oligopeptide transport system substrate-binding protein